MDCKIDKCEDKIHARGWCNKHYIRWKKYKDPLFTKMHGYGYHPLCKIWHHMKDRCYNLNNKQYKDYGGRDIIICSEWRNNVKSFIKWALPLWKEGLQIDRKNNDGNYEPSNCRFVTRAVNNLNTRLLRSTNTSNYRGVCYYKRDNKWEAKISINGKTTHLGLFNTPELAAKAYDNAVIDNRPKNFK